MKRSLCLLLCAVLLLGLCACSKAPSAGLQPGGAFGTAPTPSPAPEDTSPAPEQAPGGLTEPTPAPTPDPAPTPEPTPEPTPVPMRTRYVIPEGTTVAPEPNPACYGSISLDEPEKALEVIARARELGLLGEDEPVVFDPGVDFYRGADSRDIEYYLDETILVLCWKEVVDGRTCSFAEIKIADPSQFRRKLADDTVNPANRYFCTELHDQTNAVLSLNADFYQNRDLGLVVYDRQLLRFPEQGYAGGYTFSNCLQTCFVDSRGEFHFTELGQITGREQLEQYVADNDILFSIAFGPILIRDGQVQECSWYPVGEIDKVYSRAGIGQVDELHYLYMSLNHAPEKSGSWTVNEFARHFGEKNVRVAYCLDGGQTGEMVFRGQVYNHVDFGEERRVSDDIYFATGVGATAITEPVPNQAKLRLRFASELSPLPEHDSFSAGEGAQPAELLLSTDRPIRDLRILSLTAVEQEGELRFAERELYAQPSLTAERPLLLRLVIYGDLPGYAIAYTDADGTPRRWAVGFSGEDGSPRLWEYESAG